LFASSWYIFLTYIYDARSHLYQIGSLMFVVCLVGVWQGNFEPVGREKDRQNNTTNCCVVLFWRSFSLPTSYTHNGDDTP